MATMQPPSSPQGPVQSGPVVAPSQQPDILPRNHLTKTMMMSLPQRTVRRQAYIHHVATNVSKEEMVEHLYRNNEIVVVRPPTHRRSLRVPVFEMKLVEERNIDAPYGSALEIQTENRNFRPNKRAILKEARIDAEREKKEAEEREKKNAEEREKRKKIEENFIGWLNDPGDMSSWASVDASVDDAATALHPLLPDTPAFASSPSTFQSTPPGVGSFVTVQPLTRSGTSSRSRTQLRTSSAPNARVITHSTVTRHMSAPNEPYSPRVNSHMKTFQPFKHCNRVATPTPIPSLFPNGSETPVYHNRVVVAPPSPFSYNALSQSPPQSMSDARAHQCASFMVPIPAFNPTIGPTRALVPSPSIAVGGKYKPATPSGSGFTAFPVPQKLGPSAGIVGAPLGYRPSPSTSTSIRPGSPMPVFPMYQPNTPAYTPLSPTREVPGLSAATKMITPLMASPCSPTFKAPSFPRQSAATSSSAQGSGGSGSWESSDLTGVTHGGERKRNNHGDGIHNGTSGSLGGNGDDGDESSDEDDFSSDESDFGSEDEDDREDEQDEESLNALENDESSTAHVDEGSLLEAVTNDIASLIQSAESMTVDYPSPAELASNPRWYKLMASRDETERGELEALFNKILLALRDIFNAETTTEGLDAHRELYALSGEVERTGGDDALKVFWDAVEGMKDDKIKNEKRKSTKRKYQGDVSSENCNVDPSGGAANKRPRTSTAASSPGSIPSVLAFGAYLYQNTTKKSTRGKTHGRHGRPFPKTSHVCRPKYPVRVYAVIEVETARDPLYYTPQFRSASTLEDFSWEW